MLHEVALFLGILLVLCMFTFRFNLKIILQEIDGWLLLIFLNS